MLKLTFDDYEKWALEKYDNQNHIWQRWSPNYQHPNPQGSGFVSQTEMLEYHYSVWLSQPDNLPLRMTNTLIEFFETLESDYAFAISVLGEDYFA